MEAQAISDKAIKKKILSMVIPITAENILQMTAGLVSMAMVGRISAVAVGAIGLSNVIMRLIWAVFKGISIGTTILVAQSYGAGNVKKLARVSVQGILLSIAFASLFLVLLLVSSEQVLEIFGAGPELITNATLYTRILSFSLPATAAILIVSGIFQGMGDAKTPMLIVGVLNITNIILSYVLIFGVVGIPAMGIQGAAIAYTISYVIAAIMAFRFLLSKSKGLRGRIGLGVRINIPEAFSIMRYGFPSSFETIFWVGSSIFVTRAVLTYGENAYAAYQLGMQAEAVSFMPAMGLAVCATAFIGQSVGSKDMELGRKYYKHLVKYTLMFSTIAGLIMALFPGIIMGALTNSRELIGIGSAYLIVMGISQIPQNMTGLYNGTLKGAGYVNMPLVIITVGIWLVRIPGVLAATFLFKADLIWIWAIMGMDLFVRYILAYANFRQKNIFKNGDNFQNQIFEDISQVK